MNGPRWRLLSKLSFRAKLIISNAILASAIIIGMAYYLISRATATSDFLAGQLTQTVQEETESELNATARRFASDLDQFFGSLLGSVETLKTTLQVLITNERADALSNASSLSRLPQGSWGNSKTEPGSIFVSNKEKIPDSILSEIGVIRQIDLIAPGIMEKNPDMLAIYFGSVLGETLYYPNIDLAANLPPDYDVTEQSWFVAANPEANSAREIVCSDPYQNASLKPIITCSAPVYDSSERFRGVVAMDVQLAHVTDLVSLISVGKTGYAFVIDAKGHVIAMPQEGYPDFGLVVGPGEDPSTKSILKTASSAVFSVLGNMVKGATGLRSVTIGDSDKYITYRPVTTIGYSLGLVVPVNEMQGKVLATQLRLDAERRDTLIKLVEGSLLVILVFLAATFWLGNALTSPLLRLTHTASLIAGGDLNANATVNSQDEIGVMASTFNLMTKNLRDLINNLELRVKERTAELFREKQFSEALVVNSPVAIVSIDPQSNVMAWNPGAENLFGYTKDEAIGSNIDDLVAKNERLHAEAVGYSKQGTSSEFHSITKRTRKDGSLVDVDLRGVPLSVNNEVIGLIAIYNDITELQRAREEAEAARDAAERALKETQQRNAELASLNSVGEAMAQTLDAKIMTRIIGDKVRDTFQAEVTNVLLLDSATNMIHIPYAYFREYTEVEPFPFGLGLVSRVINSRQPLVLGTYADQVKFGVKNLQAEDVTESYLGVPIIIGEKVLGVVAIESYQQNAYDENNMRLLQTLSSSMGAAIENARLFEETQHLLKETEQRAAELGVIGKVSEALVKESELASTIELIGTQTQEIFNADIAYVALVDQKTNLIHFPYQIGESFSTLKIGEGYTGRIIETGEPMLINSGLEERSRELGVKRVGKKALSYLGVPIKTTQGTIGAISVQSTTQEGFFNDDSLRLLTTIASNAGSALHNAQLFSDALENLRQVEILTNAAGAIQQSAYEPAMIQSVAERTDALGELARVFRNMADEVRIREQRLKRQLEQLQLDIEEKQLAKAETVSVYIPMDRRQAMANNRTLPERAQGATLFADVSGFTALTEALANELGLQRGAEEVIRQLNRVYTVLIDEVHRSGGSVINFSGDAITCWFDDLDLLGAKHFSASGDRAVACALAMQKGMQQFATITRPDGKMITLSIKVAIATGPARRILVGEGTAHQIDVLAGSTLALLAETEHQANKGEIIIAVAGIRALEKKFSVSEWREGKQFAVVTGLMKDAVPSPWPVLPNDAIPEAQTQPWMLPAVFEKVRAGKSDMLSELRQVAALFLKFGGLKYDTAANAGARLDEFIQWVEQVIAPHAGSIIQLTVGDKGSYLYVVFGAPVAHMDDAAKAVLAGMELANPPKKLSYITDLQIGLAYGQMRVGAYGGSTHRTYGAIGDKTNLAARLMQAATPSLVKTLPGQRAVIICNDTIYEATQTQIEYEALPPIVVKGKTEPIAIYRPIRKRDETAVTSANLSGGSLERARLIDRLSPGEQLTLKVASVIGQIFTFETLSAIYPEEQNRADLQKHLRTLADQDLIYKRSTETLSYSFKDSQIHETAYNLMLFAQRRQLHRAVAELLEQTVFSVPPYAEIAHHWQAADEIPKAVEYLEKAGEHARELGDFEEATRFFNASLALNK